MSVYNLHVWCIRQIVRYTWRIQPVKGSVQMVLVFKIKFVSDNGSKEQSFMVWWQWISGMNGWGTKWNKKVSDLKWKRRKASPQDMNIYKFAWGQKS